MNAIRFLGASGTVTGSNYFLKPENGRGIIIDMGMFQGTHAIEDLNYLPLEFDPKDVAGVVITHAHLDHVGRLPILIKAGYRGPIYLTEATRVLAELTLLDAAKITQENEEHPPLYDETDVFRTISLMEIVAYEQEFQIGNYTLKLRDAGHILGSAFLEVFDPSAHTFKRIVFSGDLGNTPEDLVRPTQLVDRADAVIMESTYGDRTHSNEDPHLILQNEINAIEQSGGTLLIPSFSLERVQELLHLINHLKKEDKVRAETQIYLDSPMAIKATRVYKQFRKLYSDELSKHARKEDPFDFPGLQFVEKAKESHKIHENNDAKVIIAGSGMMTGGRILGHALHYLPMPSTRLLFVGFQAEETLGRIILEGAREIEINGQKITIQATVIKSSGLSAHADQPKLVSWLKHMKDVKQVFLVHGEQMQRNTLSEIIKTQLGIKDLFLPMRNDSTDLK